MASWNIHKSIEHLSTHAEPKSVGRCAKYVRQAIEAGGMDTNGRPGSAYQYKGYLPSKGFNAIGNITGRDKQATWTKLNAQVGDISVMDHGEHGHICMWNGSKWISDFPQNNMWPYRGDGTCTIFRFGGHVDGNLEPYTGELSTSVNATNVGGVDLSSLKWETNELETSAKGNGIEYKVTKDGEIKVSISESELGGDATDGTIFSMPRYEQPDNILFSTLCSIKKNIIKEIFESANILFDESDNTKQNVTDLIKYKEKEQYNISNNKLVKEKIQVIDTKETNKNISKVKLNSNPNIRYKHTLFGDTNLTISEGIIIKLHIDNNLFEGTMDAGIDLENINTAITNITDSGISNEMLNHICMHETGKTFGYTMKPADLNGYDLGDANGHKTFGYGILYHPNGKFMDTIKSNWSQQELENIFLSTAKNMMNKVNNWANKFNINLNQHQKDAIVSAVYNFGPGFLNKNVCKMIANDPNDINIKNTWAHLSDAQGKKYPGLIKRRQFEAGWYFA